MSSGDISTPDIADKLEVHAKAAVTDGSLFRVLLCRGLGDGKKGVGRLIAAFSILRLDLATLTS
jgi:hypothetical protein